MLARHARLANLGVCLGLAGGRVRAGLARNAGILARLGLARSGVFAGGAADANGRVGLLLARGRVLAAGARLADGGVGLRLAGDGKATAGAAVDLVVLTVGGVRAARAQLRSAASLRQHSRRSDGAATGEHATGG